MTHILVRDVGEFGLIEILRRSLPASVREGPGLEVGIGDDAAVWRPLPGTEIVVTTDSLVQDIHFKIEWTDWKSLGDKTLAVNVSDLAAMAATPKLAVVTLGLRGSERIEDLRAFYHGLGSLARREGMIVAGGDIVRSPHALFFHVTALGEVEQGKRMTRSGARVGDVIGVSGTLGASAAGLRLLALDAKDARQRAATADLLVRAHLRPEPRVALGKLLPRNGATAAMDLSDGLLGDLPKILEASGVSAVVETRRLPVAAAVRALFPDIWLDLAMRGGEDYELLFTAPCERWAAIEREAAQLGVPVTAIGEITPRADDASITLIDLEGAPIPTSSGAFDHFAPG
jgi:thiamine-monophosphate kinase